jgi:HTH-type transcriptional regulator / antitoxin HipB
VKKSTNITDREKMKTTAQEPLQALATDPAEIGKIVRQARKQAGLRQAQAAALCGVGTRFLSDLENGKPTLHLGKVLKVLHGFGLRVIIKRKGFSE